MKEVYFLANWGGYFTCEKTSDIIKQAIREVYIPLGRRFRGRTNPRIPILKWGGNRTAKLLLSRGQIQERQLYSPTSLTIPASNKQGLYQIMRGEHMPKTVFSAREARDLRFPLVYKPRCGHGGIGIEIIPALSNLEGRSMGVFQEHIPIYKEYRCLCVGDKIIFQARRKPSNSKSRLIRKGRPFRESHTVDTKNGYEWFPQAPDNQFTELCRTVMQKTGLKFAGIDVCIDTNGRKWLIEVNTAPGLNFDQVLLLYPAIREHWYGAPISETEQQTLHARGQQLINDQRARHQAPETE